MGLGVAVGAAAVEPLSSLPANMAVKPAVAMATAASPETSQRKRLPVILSTFRAYRHF
jgi:hypothetical protein